MITITWIDLLDLFFLIEHYILIIYIHVGRKYNRKMLHKNNALSAGVPFQSIGALLQIYKNSLCLKIDIMLAKVGKYFNF